MKRKAVIYKAIIAIAVAMVLFMPVAAFGNIGTVGTTSNSDSDDEKPVIDTEELSIVNDDNSAVLVEPAIYVDDDADPSWYNATQVKTIREGITNATAGDTVYVYNGTYYEDEILAIYKQLCLVGESRENVIVIGGGYMRHVFSFNAHGIRITNFTLTNGNSGIYVNDVAFFVNNCDSYGNTYGIYLFSSTGLNSMEGNRISIVIENSDFHDNSQHGIYVCRMSWVNIMNCNIYNNNEMGIYLESSSGNMSGNILRDNAMYNNSYNFCIYGEAIRDYRHDIDTSNTIDGKTVYCIVGESDRTFDETDNAGFILLDRCNNITIEQSDPEALAEMDVQGIILLDTVDTTISGVDVHNCYNGILFINSPNNDIINCNIYDNYRHGISINSRSDNCDITTSYSYNNRGDGIFLDYSSNCYITNCSSYGNSVQGIHIYYSSWCNVLNCSAYDNHRGDGIRIRQSDSCNVLNSSVYNSIYGIYLIYADYGNVINCHSYNNDRGINIEGDENNIINCHSYNNDHGINIEGNNNNIINNNVSSNIGHGIVIRQGSGGNRIYHNNFVNDWNAYIYYGSYNTWDNGYPSGGNYWSDYSGEDNNHGPGQDILGSDGIGDSPYFVSGGNQDNYPFMEPYVPVPTMFIEITALSSKWNIIASPFSYSVDKADIIVEYDGTDYTWADAVSGGIIANALFGWDRISQIYLQSDVLDPGCGYWLWSYNDCILKVLEPETESDEENMEPYVPTMVITTLSSKWNIIAVPFSYSVDKADIIVEYDGTDYTWADAVSGGIIANALFGWDRISQIYLQSDVLEPGCGYWLWSYNDCILKYMME